MGGCKGRRDMEEWRRDVAEMGLSRLDVATWATVARLGLMSRHGFDVATWTSVWEVAT